MTGLNAPSRILVLNAAEGLLQFALARREPVPGAGGERLVSLCAQSWRAPSQGAELLAAALRDALARLGLEAPAIEGIACVRGPGSFTGLRLALATAAGLSRATGALQAGLDYMPLLAENALMFSRFFAERPRRLWVLTHARRQLLHVQGFETCDGLRPLGEILVLPPEEAARIIVAEQAGRKETGKTLLLGSGLTRNRDALEKALAERHCRETVLLPPDFDHPAFPSLLRGAERAAFSKNDIAPLYVRPADAEENLESIAASLGLDPKAARKKLDSIRGG